MSMYYLHCPLVFYNTFLLPHHYMVYGQDGLSNESVYLYVKSVMCNPGEKWKVLFWDIFWSFLYCSKSNIP